MALPYKRVEIRRGRKQGVSRIERKKRIERREISTGGGGSFWVKSAKFGSDGCWVEVWPTYVKRGEGGRQSLGSVDVIVRPEDAESAWRVKILDRQSGKEVKVKVKLDDKDDIFQVRESLLTVWRDGCPLDLDWGKDEPDYGKLVYWLIRRAMRIKIK